MGDRHNNLRDPMLSSQDIRKRIYKMSGFLFLLRILSVFGLTNLPILSLSGYVHFLFIWSRNLENNCQNGSVSGSRTRKLTQIRFCIQKLTEYARVLK